MENLSNIEPCDKELSKVLNYLQSCKDDDPFTLKQLDDDERYFLRMDESGFYLISFVKNEPVILSEDENSNGYPRISYKDQHLLKHRLAYKMYGAIPDGIDFNKMVVHHKNQDKQDCRLNNLYLISRQNHAILHKFIKKYGAENVEI